MKAVGKFIIVKDEEVVQKNDLGLIITEKSARKDLLKIVKAGVGSGPTKITSIPIDINPEAKAGSNI